MNVKLFHIKIKYAIYLPRPIWSSTSMPFNCDAMNLACS